MKKFFAVTVLMLVILSACAAPAPTVVPTTVVPPTVPPTVAAPTVAAPTVAAPTAVPDLTANINLITFGDQDGKMLGTYKQTAPGQWAEAGADGNVTFTFKEVKRDDSSIYINDASRSMDLQLDLKSMTIIYNNALLYSILKAEHNITVGINLITFGDQNGKMLGAYKQTAPGKWAETGADGNVTFTFKEVKRDDTSIYINDASRSMDLQLDLKSMTIIYNNALLYSILKAE